MIQINVTDFRQNLQAWLGRIKHGESIQLTNRGKVVARIIPETDAREAALQRLQALRGTMIVGDIVNFHADEDWTADEDNL